MVKIYLVDVLVWKNNLLPTKPTLSLRTGFRANSAHFPTSCQHETERHAQDPEPRPLGSGRDNWCRRLPVETDLKDIPCQMMPPEKTRFN